MDKEKYLNFKNAILKHETYAEQIHDIKYFLDNYSQYFQAKESIEALKDIREYLTSAYQTIDTDLRRARYKFQHACTHEIIFKYKDINRCYCALCDRRVELSKQNAIIIEFEYKHPTVAFAEKLTNKTIMDLIEKDQDVLDNFEVTFKKNKQEAKVTQSIVLRRIYAKKRNY